MSIKHVVCFYWIIFSSWSHLFKLLNISKDLTSDYLFIIYNKSDFYPIFQSTAAAKSLQSCPTLCDPIDGSPPGSSVPGILQARTLERVAIAFSSACMLSHFSRVRLCAALWTAAHQAPLSTGFSRQEYSSGLPFPSPYSNLETWQCLILLFI